MQVDLEKLTAQDISKWLESLQPRPKTQCDDEYELMLWWKMVAKANNIQWIVTQNERDLQNRHSLKNQGSQHLQEYTNHYLTSKYGQVSMSDSSDSLSSHSLSPS